MVLLLLMLIVVVFRCGCLELIICISLCNFVCFKLVRLFGNMFVVFLVIMNSCGGLLGSFVSLWVIFISCDI